MEILEINSDMVPKLNVGNITSGLAPNPIVELMETTLKVPPIPHSQNCENKDFEEIT